MSSDNRSLNSAGGGGATSITFKSGLLSKFSNDRDSIIIVSGSGGGGAGTSNGGSAGGYIAPTLNSQNHILNGGSQVSGYKFGIGQNGIKATNRGGWAVEGTSGAGAGYYGGFAYQGLDNSFQTTSASGGSSYIGNSLLTDKHMTCYNCKTSDEESTKTISNTCHSSTPTKDCSKEGNGYVRITYLG